MARPPWQTERQSRPRGKPPSLGVAAKCVVCVVALLGFVGSTTTFVARLASIRILPATQSVEELIRGFLIIQFPVHLYLRRIQADCAHYLRNKRYQPLAITLHPQYIVCPRGKQLVHHAQRFAIQAYYL